MHLQVEGQFMTANQMLTKNVGYLERTRREGSSP